MARRGNRKSASPHRPLGGVAGPESREERAGRVWVVRRIPGQSARTTYVCPFCDRDIRVGTPHVVAFPADEPDGLSQRRHWHSNCWQRFR